MKYRILIIGLVLFALGAALFFSAWASSGFGNLDLSTVEYEKKSLVIDESFHSLYITQPAEDVHIEPSPDGFCRVEYVDSNRAVYRISVENGCLTINRDIFEGSNWYDNIKFSTDSADNLLIIFLPRGSYDELRVNLASADFYAGGGFDFEKGEINTASGDVDIGAVITDSLNLNTASGDMRIGGLELDGIELSTASGDIRLGDASVSGSLGIHSASGDIELTDINCGSLEAETASGTQELCNVICSDAMNLESTSGDIRLEHCDAASLLLESTSGLISGTLLSGKDFDAQSTSGSIKLPESSGSAKCRIKTTSGDIHFEIAS